MTSMSDFMTTTISFSEAFKKLRLESHIESIRELCELLVGFDFILEESTMSRWQNGSRIPKNRMLLLALIKIFAIRGAISTIEEANKLLTLAHLLPLTDEEEKKYSLKSKNHLIFSLPPQPDIFGTEFMEDQVREQLSENNGHLRLVLWGLPGTGKSSKAISIGYTFQSFFQKGIIWVRVLDKSIIQLTQEIIEILQNNHSSHDVSETIFGIYKSKDFLIIFDNVNDEQVLFDISNNFAHSSYVITTNFKPKNDNHFYVMKVDPFSEKYTTELFSRIVGRALTKNEIALVLKIANQLGNLPLPLSIVANTLQSSLSEANLEMTLELLKRKQVGLIFFKDNFSQIISAFELLFDQLSSDEKAILMLIAKKQLPLFKVNDLLSGKLDLSQTQWALFTLNAKSLIEKTAVNGYRIHPVLYRFLCIKQTD